jgi:hypothetical protein
MSVKLYFDQIPEDILLEIFYQIEDLNTLKSFGEIVTDVHTKYKSFINRRFLINILPVCEPVIDHEFTFSEFVDINLDEFQIFMDNVSNTFDSTFEEIYCLHKDYDLTFDMISDIFGTIGKSVIKLFYRSIIHLKMPFVYDLLRNLEKEYYGILEEKNKMRKDLNILEILCQDYYTYMYKSKIFLDRNLDISKMNIRNKNYLHWIIMVRKDFNLDIQELRDLTGGLMMVYHTNLKLFSSILARISKDTLLGIKSQLIGIPNSENGSGLFVFVKMIQDEIDGKL